MLYSSLFVMRSALFLFAVNRTVYYFEFYRQTNDCGTQHVNRFDSIVLLFVVGVNFIVTHVDIYCRFGAR